MARKTYLTQDVYRAAKARLEFIFDEFEHIYFSFSGGKDSGVMMELALEVARERDRLPLHALLIDLEGHYREHIEYSLRLCDRPEIKPYWICLPISLRNAVSQFEPKWVPWEEEKRDIWVRPMPDRPYVITEHNMPEEWTWFRKGQEFEEFILYFADWFADHCHADKTACVVGIRADESMNRYRTIVNDRKTRYADQGWTTLIKGLRNTVYNAYPIYDWRVEDIWTYVGKTGCDYNKIYDYMYKTGRSVHDMRICQPYGDDQRKGLDLFQECEPETWFEGGAASIGGKLRRHLSWRDYLGQCPRWSFLRPHMGELRQVAAIQYAAVPQRALYREFQHLLPLVGSVLRRTYGAPEGCHG